MKEKASNNRGNTYPALPEPRLKLWVYLLAFLCLLNFLCTPFKNCLFLVSESQFFGIVWWMEYCLWFGSRGGLTLTFGIIVALKSGEPYFEKKPSVYRLLLH